MAKLDKVTFIESLKEMTILEIKELVDAMKKNSVLTQLQLLLLLLLVLLRLLLSKLSSMLYLLMQVLKRSLLSRLLRKSLVLD